MAASEGYGTDGFRKQVPYMYFQPILSQQSFHSLPAPSTGNNSRGWSPEGVVITPNYGSKKIFSQKEEETFTTHGCLTLTSPPSGMNNVYLVEC